MKASNGSPAPSPDACSPHSMRPAPLSAQRPARSSSRTPPARGGTVGRTFDELAALIAAAGGDARLGVCLDTQHLFASGVPYRDETEANAVVSSLERTIGPGRLACIHLNDSKVALGANRDRHENLGEGEIGAEALGHLISHPGLAAVPAILEVPGSGEGPRAQDVTAAREILSAGLQRRNRRKGILAQ